MIVLALVASILSPCVGTRMAIVVRAPASVYNVYDGVRGIIPVCHLLKFIPERNTLCLH